MPYYTLAPDGGWRVQAFADEGAPETAIALGEAERDLKAAMLAEHRTQAAVLSLLPPGVERFRPAPDHDFHRLPNGGALLYERQRWGMTGERWLSATRAAARELGLPA
jgi:hypothetical protein